MRKRRLGSYHATIHKKKRTCLACSNRWLEQKGLGEATDESKCRPQPKRHSRKVPIFEVFQLGEAHPIIFRRKKLDYIAIRERVRSSTQAPTSCRRFHSGFASIAERSSESLPVESKSVVGSSGNEGGAAIILSTPAEA